MFTLFSGKKFRLVAVTFVISAALPVMLYLVQRPQETRKLAQEVASQPLAPYVAITTPFEGQRVTGTTTINATILNEANVSAVEFYIDDKVRATVSRSPFTFAWNTVSEVTGVHTVTVRALDDIGNVGVKSIRVNKGE